MAMKSLIRFDWAAKRILRDKANFEVLEGFLSVLLRQQIHIKEILESEGNQDQSDSKFNRVDIMASNQNDELIIVEIQLSRQVHFLERMLFGVGKALTENIRIGEGYEKVKKIYSIGILYFDFGSGEDYVYHGQTRLLGLHTGDEFILTDRDREGLDIRPVKDIFPEYYLIRVNEFDRNAVTPLEEWMEYLKTGKVKEDTDVPGLREAKKKLDWLNMSEKERKAYDNYLLNLMNEKECLDTARLEGKEEGIAEGIAIGEERANLLNARKMKEAGIDLPTISLITGISPDKIKEL
ncbi:MAG: Rpn family recombination-promoting nuclease/putative transposase [Muribaculaceae bacterium]|nr:Rpn family recombination-promoting nuclease/putative transposase [Muribaculaceae bacterium]